jgi:serine/threonine protein kinase
MFYNHSGQLYAAYRDHPGVDSLCLLLAHQEDKYDLWLVYELCGQPLNKVLYETKGQFFNGERIYEVNQSEEIYSILEENNSYQFKLIIKKILQGLSLLAKAGMVHCDLKSENVLVEIDYQKRIVS